MSNAISGYGTLLKVGDGGGPETFTTIAEVASIGGPSFASDTIDVTNHSSPSAVREFIASLIDPGELTFTINFIPTNATHNPTTGLMADMLARVKRNYQMVFPDGGSTTWGLVGIVTGFGINAPIDDKLSADVTIKLTGLPTFS